MCSDFYFSGLERDHTIGSDGKAEGTVTLQEWQGKLGTETSSRDSAGPTGDISLRSPLVAAFIPFCSFRACSWRWATFTKETSFLHTTMEQTLSDTQQSQWDKQPFFLWLLSTMGHKFWQVLVFCANASPEIKLTDTPQNILNDQQG